MEQNLSKWRLGWKEKGKLKISWKKVSLLLAVRGGLKTCLNWLILPGKIFIASSSLARLLVKTLCKNYSTRKVGKQHRRFIKAIFTSFFPPFSRFKSQQRIPHGNNLEAWVGNSWEKCWRAKKRVTDIIIHPLSCSVILHNLQTMIEAIKFKKIQSCFCIYAISKTSWKFFSSLREIFFRLRLLSTDVHPTLILLFKLFCCCSS